MPSDLAAVTCENNELPRQLSKVIPKRGEQNVIGRIRVTRAGRHTVIVARLHVGLSLDRVGRGGQVSASP